MKKRIKTHPLFFFIFALFSGALSAEDLRVSVMSFNVQNLFDTTHDTGKMDITYLPQSQKSCPAHRILCSRIRVKKWREECLTLDWGEKPLSQKLARIGQVIRSTNRGRGPDLLILQEVENIALLERLIRDHLPGLGYRAFLLEGDDERGIDVAMMTRLEAESDPILHRIPFGTGFQKRARDTRGILELTLRHPQMGRIRAFGVHLPSAFHPSSMREKSIEFLNQIAFRHRDEALRVVGGDFNVSAKEEEKKGVLKKHAQGQWLLSHLEGCRECRGTAFHRGWSFLDQIWVSKDSIKAGWSLDAGSIRVVNDLPFQKTGKNSTPHAFEILPGGRVAGVSDHWPIYLELNFDVKRTKKASPVSRASLAN
jgi:endonuclease/exonuclease/phosphatase family metal-dependent hydrolase